MRHTSRAWQICGTRPEGRKTVAPAARPGTLIHESADPEGRKIDSHNLTPLRGWASRYPQTLAFGRC
jgi:hypothetical protein